MLLATQGYGQQHEAETSAIKLDTAKITKNLKMILLPIVFYTPETTFGGGLKASLGTSNKYSAS